MTTKVAIDIQQVWQSFKQDQTNQRRAVADEQAKGAEAFRLPFQRLFPMGKVLQRGGRCGQVGHDPSPELTISRRGRAGR